MDTIKLTDDGVEIADLARAIGRLGHDINNQLAIILTSATFVLEGLDHNHSLRQEAEEILKAGRRINELNQHLLTLSCKETSFSSTDRVEGMRSPSSRGFQKGCILVVEDDEHVRHLVCRSLVASGYEVLEAPNSHEALVVCEHTTKTINLLLTDIIMPGASGKVLADQLTRDHPELKVLFMSGYADELASWRSTVASKMSFLRKPFGNYELLSCVREVLGETVFESQSGNPADVH